MGWAQHPPNLISSSRIAFCTFECRSSLCSMCLRYETFELADNSFFAETKSWRDAQNHCRGLSSDLISILSSAQNVAVHNLSGSQKVWIGLFKDPWKWSDGSNSSFRFWLPSQPNYFDGQDCTAAIFRGQGKWNDLKCTSSRNFVCRGGKLPIF